MKDLEKFLPALSKADKVLEQIREIEQNPPAWEDADFPSPLNVDTAEILLSNTVDEITEAQEAATERIVKAQDATTERITTENRRPRPIEIFILVATILTLIATITVPILLR
jgi:hypothetical protein